MVYAIVLTFFQIWGKREVRYNVVQAHEDIRPIIRSRDGLSLGGGKS